MGRLAKQEKGFTMYSKKQKKMISRLMRENQKHHGRKRELRSLRESYHTVRYCESWTEYTIIDYNSDIDNQYKYLDEWLSDEMQASRNSLPYYDCSGKSFISGYRVASMPCGFAIIVYYDIDC